MNPLGLVDGQRGEIIAIIAKEFLGLRISEMKGRVGLFKAIICWSRARRGFQDSRYASGVNIRTVTKKNGSVVAPLKPMEWFQKELLDV